MNQPLAPLLERYDRLVVLDTETTGLSFKHDEIIELAAVTVELADGAPQVTRQYDRLIRLSPGRRLSDEITRLTGITQEALDAEGISKAEACRDFQSLLGERTLLAAYNAHFDLSFLYYFLHRDGDCTVLKAPDFLDVLSVYKDRRAYPHKLKNAIEEYNLQDRVVNSHRAIDDVLATVEVLKEMDREKSDLDRYINLFGYNPKYGVEGCRIRSVRYVAQPYGSSVPLYEQDLLTKMTDFWQKG